MMDQDNSLLLKKALKKIRDLTLENEQLKQGLVTNEPIAIIGVGCRLPNNIHSIDDLWPVLLSKQDVISKRIQAGFLQSNKARYGGFLENPYDFAVDFFKISPRELKSIDPQQRLLLEVTWEALEHAAIKPSSLAQTNTGVFVAIGTDDYSQLMVQPSAAAIGPHYAIGTSHSTAAGRLSHWFDFKGPCIALDTACSSALVALHLACRSLQQGECHLAVVGAVNCLLTDIYFDNFTAAGMLASDGRCKVFDQRADGYVRAEGCGVFILKSLAAALQANDNILGVIKGTAINHDGHCSTITAPNGLQQEAVIRQALLAAQVNFNAIQYIETHGTGTALGDPVEINAIANLCRQSQRTAPLYLGSVKANIGHLEPAAGMVSLLKVLLCFKYGILPAQPHCEHLTDKVEWQQSSLVIPNEPIAWSDDDKLSLVGISAFGFSGTNAHAILAAYSSETPVAKMSETMLLATPLLLTLSAKSVPELKACIKQYRQLIELAADENAVQDLCYTTNCFREVFRQCVIFIAMTQSGLIQLLTNYLLSFNSPHDAVIKNVVIESPQNFNQVHTLTKADHELLKDLLPSFEALWAGEVDWNAYYNDKQFKKISLPAYPFQRETIAFDQLDQLFKKAHETVPGMLYDMTWEAITLTESLASQDFAWLIFDQNNFWSTDIISAQQVTSLTDLKVQLEKSSTQQPIAVLFHYSAIPSQAKDVAAALDMLQQLLACLRICAEVKIPIKFWLLIKTTTAFHNVVSALSGAFTSLRLELPHLLQGQIEYHQIKPLQKNIFAALKHATTELSLKVVADTCLAPRIIKLPEQSLPTDDSKLVLHSNGVYVITGGTGGIARALLSWLISAKVSAIALLSRSQPDQTLAAFIRANSACQIKHYSVDVTIETELWRVLEQIRHDMGEITGVMHAAGINYYQAYTDLDEVNIAEIFLPKVGCALSLDNYFKDKPVDFILHFSSVAAIWGTAKMTPYAAANHCLAALANESSRHLIVHWGLWDSIGMATRAFPDKRFFSGLAPIPTPDALNYLSYTLKNRQPYIIANVDWFVFLRFYQLQRSSHFFAKLPVVISDSNEALSQTMSLQSKEQSMNLDAFSFKEIVSDILACPVEKIGLDTPLQEMGIDSILALELVNRLQPYTTMPLPNTLVFDYPTIAKILLLIQPTAISVSSQKKLTEDVIAYEPIAIVGVACRVGDCQDANAFWRKMTKGESFIQTDINEILSQRHGQVLPKGLSCAGNFLQNVYDFDPEAFRLSVHEAKLMDPQQRIMLQLAWQAIESAGYAVKEMVGQNGGVFIGVSNNEYAALCRNFMEKSDEIFYVTSQAKNIIAGRISYFFGLTGSSLVIDTACSSSLMAIHQACQSIQLRESQFALAGGINLIFSVENIQSLMQANMLSKSGHCSPFDQRADGYVRAEAAGMVMLKPLAAAEADGNTILGVIRGSAANQDGQSASLTAPSSAAQIAVMEKALALSHYQGAEIDFVEAHGTGTPLGDPIELQAIEKVYAKNRSTSSPIYVNSIKSQVGHAESAAGILSLIGVLGRLQTGQLFKQYRYANLNKHIQLQTKAVVIPTTMINLQAKQMRIASINGFGFSGTNVNLIVTNYLDAHSLPSHTFQFPGSSYSFKQMSYSVVPEQIRYQYERRIRESLYGIDWIPKTTEIEAASYFTATSLQEAVKIQQAKQAIHDVEQTAYDQALIALNDFCLQSFVATVRSLGLDREPLAISQRHHRYINLLLQHVQSSGPAGDFNAIDSSDYLESTPVAHEYQVAKRVADHLASVLTDQQSALDVLFPNGDATLINAIYQRSPKSRLMNQTLAQVLQDYLKTTDLKGRPLKILEVGAGTGGTTADVLQALAGYDYHYTYTDNSLTLLTFAKQRFAAYPNIVYTVFDLENTRQLSCQFYQQFDVVIAANVIHATKKITQTIALLNQCLKLSGLLLVFEGTQPVPWIDFIFGLTPGWWGFADERQSHPLLSPLQWREKFDENKFSVAVLAPDRASGQCLILGQKQSLTTQLPPPAIILLVDDLLQVDELENLSKTYGIQLLPLRMTAHDLDNQLSEKFLQRFEDLNHPYSSILAVVYLSTQQTLRQSEDIVNLYAFVQIIRAKQRSSFSAQPLLILTQNSVYPKSLSQQPIGAALWGMAQVVRLEYPDLTVVTLDIDSFNLAYLFNEIMHGLPAPQVAYHAKTRYETSLNQLTQEDNKKAATPFVINNTAWIIAGGCGGLGQEVARWLAEQGATHIVLIGRQGLNEESKKNIDDIQQVYKTQFTVYQVNIADRLAMQNLTDELMQQGLSYKGILQLAGVVSDALIETMTFEQYQTVFDAKVFGTQNLMTLARRLSLSYFIAFSTATAVLGNIGQVNHAAVNAYLDAYLLAHKNDFERVLTLNWGPWSETGALTSALVSQIAAKGVHAFTNREGLSCLAAAMATDRDQVMPIAIDWKTFAHISSYKSLSEEVQLPPVINNIVADQFDTATIKQQLKVLFSKKLQCPLAKLSDTAGFYTLGVDSLMAITLIHELEEFYKTKFDKVLLFNYPTFEDLSQYISQYFLDKAAATTEQPSVRNALKDLIEITKEELL